MNKIFTLLFAATLSLTAVSQNDTTSKRLILGQSYPVYLNFIQDNFDPLYAQAVDSTTTYVSGGSSTDNTMYSLFTLNNGHNLYTMIDTFYNAGTRNIYQINPFTGSRKLVMPSGDMFSSIASTTDGRVFGVIAGNPISAVSGDIFEFDLAAKTKNLVTTLPTYGQKPALTYNPDDNSLYIFYSNDGASDSLAIYNLTTNVMSPKAAISGFGVQQIGGAMYYKPDTLLLVNWNGHVDYFKISTKTVIGEATNNSPYNSSLQDIAKINMINSLDNRVFCDGDSLLLKAAYFGGTYQWYKNGAPLTGKTGDSIYVTTVGNYQILAMLDATKAIWSETISVSQNAKPTVSVSAPQGTVVCGSNAIQLSGTSGGNSQWYLNGAAISGANASTYSATTSGIYNMVKTNSNGCKDSASMGINIQQYALPAVTFSLAQNMYCVNSASFALSGGSPTGGSYSGAGVSNNNFDPANGTGTITLTYSFTDANTCSNTAVSDVIVDACTGIKNVVLNSVGVYPNPFDNQITIVTNAADNLVQITNAIGQVVYSQKISFKETIELNQLSEGLYTIVISNSDSSKAFKLNKK
ncbi:MAG: T9SS type A sorting domain-containing protein [Bacteroidota bacterium]